jgi:hypothetical protein
MVMMLFMSESSRARTGGRARKRVDALATYSVYKQAINRGTRAHEK